MGEHQQSLDQLHDRLVAHVDAGVAPGVISLVAHGDEVQVDVIGRLALEGAALPRDAVFRIASLSKPITAAAAMMLVDDGVLALDEPIDDFIPELADRRVLRAIDAELDDTVHAHRAITVDDLLTCRLGLGCIMAAAGTYPIQRAEEELELHTFGPPWPPAAFSVDEWTRRLGTLPLIHQPGDGWMYNTGIQVLGVLVERASGQPFETFLRERLFDPLGIRDTSFSIDATRLSRFSTAYRPVPGPEPDHVEMLEVLDSAEHSWWANPVLPNGAGWLLSTIDDFWAFVAMLRAGGVAGDQRVLSKAALARMMMDHLHDDQRDAARPFVGPHCSWGYGMGVPEAGHEPDGVLRHGYGWDGGTGTTWRTDPSTGVAGILFTQRAMTSPEPPALFNEWYAALDDAIAGVRR